MAGAGFVRRYGYFPGTEEFNSIEGVVILDQRSPGPISGASYGVVCVVGEATNMSSVCTVNTAGEVVSSFRVREVYGGSDLLDKIGGFDSTLGDFGDEMGNLFVEVRNKRFSRLVVCPVDLVRPASGTTQYAVRCWRQLPTNLSATDTTPITPGVAARLEAGSEFRASASRIITAAPVDFTGTPPRVVGVNGTTSVSGLPAATVTLTSSGANFETNGVAIGDVVVVGSFNAVALSQNLVCAATLRVVTVDSETQLTLQKLAGGNFTASTDWLAGSALAYRVHRGTDADSGAGYVLSGPAGYSVLARPITATVSAATALAAYPTPTAPTGAVWDELSGLAGVTHPTGALTYDAAVHAPNLVTTSLLRTRYIDAFNALLNDVEPVNSISLVTCARKDNTIQSHLRLHCLSASQRGMSRMYVISPKLTTLTKSTILSAAAPGVGGTGGGAIRNERGIYSWPGCRTFIPELVGTEVDCSDGTTTDDGYIDVSMDTWVACLLSNLQPELNPGQAAEPVPTIFSPIIGYQRGTPSLDMSDYILFKQAGICALRMDRVVGPILQSGITTSLTSGEKNINRRRMADFIQDSLAARYNQMSKMLGRQSVKDSLLSETVAFYQDLLSDNNPEAQRIESYSVDDKSPNTPALSAQGIWIIKSVVRMLPTLDVIVCQSEVSPDAITVTAS
jgi:hypothetical protein